jgi:hypothetical protein
MNGAGTERTKAVQERRFRQPDHDRKTLDYLLGKALEKRLSHSCRWPNWASGALKQ